MEQNKNHITDIIFVLSLFCVFTVLALFVVILGVNVYKGISSSMDANYSARTSISYLTEKIRQSDAKGGIAVRDLDGRDALVLTQSAGESEYETWIFADGGSLKEVMVPAGEAVEPSFGQPIMGVETMEIDAAGEGLLRIRVTDASGQLSQNLVSALNGEVG